MMDASVSHDTYVPALGKFWESACSTRLLMTRPDSSSTTEITDLTVRTIRIIKCNQLKTGNECTVNISDIGIR